MFCQAEDGPVNSTHWSAVQPSTPGGVHLGSGARHGPPCFGQPPGLPAVLSWPGHYHLCHQRVHRFKHPLRNVTLAYGNPQAPGPSAHLPIRLRAAQEMALGQEETVQVIQEVAHLVAIWHVAVIKHQEFHLQVNHLAVIHQEAIVDLLLLLHRPQPLPSGHQETVNLEGILDHLQDHLCNMFTMLDKDLLIHGRH